MVELLQQSSSLDLAAHGNDLDQATHACCRAELLLVCNEFDMDSLKLVSNPDHLTEIGFAEGPAAAIVRAMHEHIAMEADVEVEAAIARLH
jgi:hypothetical protein